MNKKFKNKNIFSRRVNTYRFSYALVFIFSVGALAAAWYLQNIKDLAPCPLCIMQRFGFFAFAIFSLVGLIQGTLSKPMNVISAFTGCCAVGIAAYHNWKLMQPNFECGIDPVQNFVNNLPTAQLWPDMFMATGMCGAKLPLVLGLGIPQWSLLGLVCLTLIFLWRCVKD